MLSAGAAAGATRSEDTSPAGVWHSPHRLMRSFPRRTLPLAEWAPSYQDEAAEGDMMRNPARPDQPGPIFLAAIATSASSASISSARGGCVVKKLRERRLVLTNARRRSRGSASLRRPPLSQSADRHGYCLATSAPGPTRQTRYYELFRVELRRMLAARASGGDPPSCEPIVDRHRPHLAMAPRRAPPPRPHRQGSRRVPMLETITSFAHRTLSMTRPRAPRLDRYAPLNPHRRRLGQRTVRVQAIRLRPSLERVLHQPRLAKTCARSALPHRGARQPHPLFIRSSTTGAGRTTPKADLATPTTFREPSTIREPARRSPLKATVSSHAARDQRKARRTVAARRISKQKPVDFRTRASRRDGPDPQDPATPRRHRRPSTRAAFESGAVGSFLRSYVFTARPLRSLLDRASLGPVGDPVEEGVVPAGRHLRAIGACFARTTCGCRSTLRWHQCVRRRRCAHLRAAAQHSMIPGDVRRRPDAARGRSRPARFNNTARRVSDEGSARSAARRGRPSDLPGVDEMGQVRSRHRGFAIGAARLCPTLDFACASGRPFRPRGGRSHD